MTGSEDYVKRLLGGYSADETPEQRQLRECIEGFLDDKTHIERVNIAGPLIVYTRDHLLSAFAGIRRAAAHAAKSGMSAQQVADATGLSVVTVSRLVTEKRNY